MQYEIQIQIMQCEIQIQIMQVKFKFKLHVSTFSVARILHVVNMQRN